MALILDAGVLFAALDRRDKHHASCRGLIDNSTELRVIPAMILPEVDYLISERVGAGPMIGLLRDVDRGVFVIEDLAFEDYRRVWEILDKYADQDVGLVDAAVLAIVERFGERKLATIDHRHFSMLRPRHTESLELLP